jgi:hypothetical protein
MFVWGTLTMLLAACKTAASLYATRFFLGIFEAVGVMNNRKSERMQERKDMLGRLSLTGQVIIFLDLN